MDCCPILEDQDKDKDGQNSGNDEFGYRTEFVNLVRLAKSAAAMQP